MTNQDKASLPTIRRQAESVSPSGWYLILSDDINRWNKTTGVYATIEECYAEARQIAAKQFGIPADARIVDFHGEWPVA